jgi:hypothetical protein
MITESGKLIKFTKNKNCKEKRYKSLKVEMLKSKKIILPGGQNLKVVNIPSPF